MKWFLLNLIPRRLRSHRPFRHWFWQAGQLAEACEWSERMHKAINEIANRRIEEK